MTLRIVQLRQVRVLTEGQSRLSGCLLGECIAVGFHLSQYQIMGSLVAI